MNKKMILSIIVLVILLVGAALFVNRTSRNAMPKSVSASYSDGSTVLVATFNIDNDTVIFTHASVGTVTLPRALSASGARYTNEDEHIVLWEHQGEVTITEEGKVVFKGQKESGETSSAKNTSSSE